MNFHPAARKMLMKLTHGCHLIVFILLQGSEDGFQHSSQASIVQLHRQRLLCRIRAVLFRATSPPLRLCMGGQARITRLGRKLCLVFGKYFKFRRNNIVTLITLAYRYSYI